MRRFEVHDSCCTVVKRLAEIIREDEVSIPQLSDDAGVHYATVHSWFKRHSPSVNNLQSVLHTLGYELIIRRKRDVR
jgi:predicted transcriptional regulator